MTLLDLAAKVEAADASEQGDLLREAWLALHPGAFADLSGLPAGVEESEEDAKARRRFRDWLGSQAYESAALTLVPERCDRADHVWPDLEGGYCTYLWEKRSLVGKSRAAARALALTAAALRTWDTNNDK